MEGRRIIAELAGLIAAVAGAKIERPALAKRLRRLADRVEEERPGAAPAPRADPFEAPALALFDYWREQCGKGVATKPTPDRIRKVKARLRDGYTVEQIRTAIRGAAAEAFEDERGHRFDDLELICRNGAKLEQFIARGGGTMEADEDPKLAELEREARRAQEERRIDDYNRIQIEIRKRRNAGGARDSRDGAVQRPSREHRGT